MFALLCTLRFVCRVLLVPLQVYGLAGDIQDRPIIARLRLYRVDLLHFEHRSYTHNSRGA